MSCSSNAICIWLLACASAFLIMLDFDNFKHINDQAGHEAGDLALCMLADNLRAERVRLTPRQIWRRRFVIILPQADAKGAAGS